LTQRFQGIGGIQALSGRSAKSARLGLDRVVDTHATTHKRFKRRSIDHIRQVQPCL